jgi:hypothetical protein
MAGKVRLGENPEIGKLLFRPWLHELAGCDHRHIALFGNGYTVCDIRASGIGNRRNPARLVI